MSLATELAAAGLNVKTVTGWGTRGGAWLKEQQEEYAKRSAAVRARMGVPVGKPVVVCHHHTALPVPFPVNRLYGDLLKCNINTKPDGTVWLVAAKACNYSSGPGSSVVLGETRAGNPPAANARERGLADDMDTNPWTFNFENDHAGTGGPMPQVQHDAIITATNVVLDYYDLDVGNVTSHSELTTRKRDPFWNGSLRAIEEIRQALEDDMPLSDEDLAKIGQLIDEKLRLVTLANGKRISYVSLDSVWNVPHGGRLMKDNVVDAREAAEAVDSRLAD